MIKIDWNENDFSLFPIAVYRKVPKFWGYKWIKLMSCYNIEEAKAYINKLGETDTLPIIINEKL